MKLAITCFLWDDPTREGRGYSFAEEHVHVLKAMIARNCTVPHRFVCVTDRQIAGVETLPIDMQKHVPGTVFARLMQHRPDYDSLIKADRILSLDIDVAIVGNIDHIVSRREDFVIWKNPNFPQPGRAFFQSSVQLFTPGARSELWADFDPAETPKWVNWRFGGKEQAWISERLAWTEATFDHRDGIYGSARLGGTGIGSMLPRNACIVSFPGARAPWQPEMQEQHPWLAQHYIY